MDKDVARAIGDVRSVVGGFLWKVASLAHIPLAQRMARQAQEQEKLRLRQEFLNLVLERAETGDDTGLKAFWREHFPGYKWWLFGPGFQVVVPDVPEMGDENGAG